MKTTTKYKGIYKGSNGMYYFATRLKDSNGNYKSIKSRCIYPSQIQAYTDLLKLKDGIIDTPQQEQDQPQIKPKIKEYSMTMEELFNEWIEWLKSKNKENTIKTTIAVCKVRLLNIVGTLSVNDCCESKTLIDYKNYLSNQPISNVMRNRAIFCYCSMMERAFYCGYISQQEYGMVKLTLTQFNANANVAKSKRKKREKLFYTHEEMNQFLSVIDNPFYHLIFKTLFITGMRISELTGLLVSDVDVVNKTINVNKIYTQSHYNSTPKTKNSVRLIPIPDNLLNDIVVYVQTNKLNNSDVLIPISQLTIRLKAIDYAKKSNLEYLNPHGFRHSCVSYLISRSIEKNNGAVPFKEIASYVGDNVETILRVYYNVTQDQTSKLTDLMRAF